MKKNLVYLLLCLSETVLAQSIIVPHLPYQRHRLGDQMSAMIKGLVWSHKYNLKYYYKPFLYSDELPIHHLAPHFSDQEVGHRVRKNISSESDIVDNSVNGNTHYIVTYGSKFKREVSRDDEINQEYEYAMQHPDFKELLETWLTPNLPSSVDWQTDKITVALHVRKGGGFDRPLQWDMLHGIIPHQKVSCHDRIVPHRFPPETFYIQQLHNLAALTSYRPMHVHIFTDDQNPASIAKRFEPQVADLPITFTYRTTENKHDKNVLEDWKAMSQADCIIRPASHFSGMSGLIGNHKITIYVRKAQWRGDDIDVNESYLVVRSPHAFSKEQIDAMKHKDINISHITDECIKMRIQELNKEKLETIGAFLGWIK